MDKPKSPVMHFQSHTDSGPRALHFLHLRIDSNACGSLETKLFHYILVDYVFRSGPIQQLVKAVEVFQFMKHNFYRGSNLVSCIILYAIQS